MWQAITPQSVTARDLEPVRPVTVAALQPLVKQLFNDRKTFLETDHARITQRKDTVATWSVQVNQTAELRQSTMAEQ
ncbi:hypothetical protein N0V91_006904 [Didymella pomorum]|uniref:Uncharacterized protein n=1 Tax=Didymella pomorum TaxID=749634 RepID=A0A9W8ZC06_9PLEO|nr:hypothetical protein N0V91_006904 [Didymella pomorum]